MIIHFFTKGDEKVASSRQRVFLLARALQRYQVDTVIHAPPIEVISQTRWPAKGRLIVGALRGLLKIRHGDLLFLQRTIYNKYFLVAVVIYLLLFRRKMIFDFDDAIYLHSPWKTKLLVKLADIVTVGSHELLKWAEQYNAHSYFIPTCTYFTSFPVKQFTGRNADAPLTLGWVGNAGAHRGNLALLVPVLVGLKRRGIRFRFVVVGVGGDAGVKGLFQDIADADHEISFIDWVDPDRIPEVIRSFDVGFMPLVDTPWERGKCALKIIEYMACGIPAIASPVGENSYVIEDGVNGFLASTTEEWVHAIERLYREPALMPHMGTQARKKIEQQYVFDVQLVRILDILGSGS